MKIKDRILSICIPAILAVLFVSFISYGALTKTYTFSSGTVISSTEVNANFDDLFNAIGTQEYTEQNYVANDASQTTNVNALDMAVKDNTDNIATLDTAKTIQMQTGDTAKYLIDWIDQDTISPDTITGKLVAIKNFPRGYIAGLQLSNNSIQSIDISVGEARSSDDTTHMQLDSILSKNVATAWATGDNLGGLDTGAIAASTGYHVWLIKNTIGGTVDALFSLSPTTPTFPNGYNKARRIGWVSVDAASRIKTFDQLGNYFYWQLTTIDMYTATSATSPTAISLDCIPGGVRTIPILTVLYTPVTGGVQYVLVGPRSQTASATNFVLRGNGSTIAANGEVNAMTDAAGTIYYSTTQADPFTIITRGFQDFRGQND